MPNSNSNRPSPLQENPSVLTENTNSTTIETEKTATASAVVTEYESRSQLNEKQVSEEVVKTEEKSEKNSENPNRLAWLPMVSFRNDEDAQNDDASASSSGEMMTASSNASSSLIDEPISVEARGSSDTQVIKASSSDDNRVSVSESGFSEESSRLSNESSLNTTKRKRNYSNGYNSETGKINWSQLT